jgi:hypothetical protein
MLGMVLRIKANCLNFEAKLKPFGGLEEGVVKEGEVRESY